MAFKLQADYESRLQKTHFFKIVFLVDKYKGLQKIENLNFMAPSYYGLEAQHKF